jgi:hypothetical protein
MTQSSLTTHDVQTRLSQHLLKVYILLLASLKAQVLGTSWDALGKHIHFAFWFGSADL